MLLALVSLLGMPFQILMPVFAKQVLGGGAHTLGFLMGAAGFGALCGAIYLASRKHTYDIGKLIPSAAAVFGAGLILFSFSKVLWLSLFLIVFVGLGMMVQMTASNTLLQVLVDDDKRGRIMAFYTMAFMGMAPFGSLIAGGLAGSVGAPRTLLIGGILCIGGAFLLSRDILSAKDMMRMPEEEITPEIARGIESSEEVTESL
jgi:MFS family permease